MSLSAPVLNLVLRLRAKRSGKDWKAKCPAHDDHKPSLSISEGADGRALVKCHAGCTLDAVLSALGMTQRDLFPQSTESTNAARMPVPLKLKRKNEQPFDWQACVEAFTEKHLERLAKWRGYSIEFCSWLKRSQLIGLYEDCIAFPVHDRAGNVVGTHYRLKDGSWRYYPQGAKVHPLIIGEVIAGDTFHVFESQWDAFAFMDTSGERSGIIITRGASNGALADVVPRNSIVYLWPQNDVPGAKWVKDACAHIKNCMVKTATIPAPHKDVNDWTRAGATDKELLDALMKAAVIREARNRNQSTELAEIMQAPPFPLHCLPRACEAMARAVCESVRVLESLSGCCTLGFLSAAIGAGLQVRSGANRVTRGNLYILPSAESGSGKSETFRYFAKPFLQFEAERLKAWKVETLPGLLAERDILESEVAKLKKLAGSTDGAFEREEIRSQLQKKKAALEEIETKLRAPVLSCEDITSQKLAELLAHNGEQLASVSADAGEIVNVLLGRYNKLDRTDESVYVKAFTGDCCKVDRKNSEPVLLQAPCLSALWLTQPDKLDSLLGERSLSDGGLIPRILACHTNCEALEIVKDASEIPASVENDYTDLIRRLIEACRLADEPFTIEPTPEALEAMNVHYNSIVKRRRADLRDVTIYAARWNEQAWRIAVCLHAGLHGTHAHERGLEIDTAKRAIELADWFAAQQLEILSASREKARRHIWDEVLSLLADRPAGIRASDVYRARMVRNADEAHALLAAMESKGELSGRDEQPESGGHVTRIFTRVKK